MNPCVFKTLQQCSRTVQTILRRSDVNERVSFMNTKTWLINHQVEQLITFIKSNTVSEVRLFDKISEILQ